MSTKHTESIFEILEISVSSAIYSLYWSRYGPRMPRSPEEIIHVRDLSTLIILFVKMWWCKEKGINFDPVPTDSHTVGQPWNLRPVISSTMSVASLIRGNEREMTITHRDFNTVVVCMQYY